MSEYKIVCVIPSFNHSEHLDQLVSCLEAKQCPVILVDDGSDEPHATRLGQFAQQHANIRFLRHPNNQGKGAALITGIEEAIRLGFTHAFQVDADGQHDLSRVDEIFAYSASHPDTLCLGCPVFDTSVPPARRYGRNISTLWVNINTLWKSQARDVLCGYRIYPLTPEMEHALQDMVDMRMGFDFEIITRLVWCGMPIENFPVRVTYRGELSHFHGSDNLKISLTHARLFITMLYRLLARGSLR